MPYLYVTIIVVVLDQISKLVVQAKMLPYQSYDYFNGLVSIIHVKNTGAAFSILPSQSLLLAIIAAVVFVTVWLNRRLVRDYPRVFQMGVAIALGGAVGNFIDRVRLGGVVDFIDIHYWPVFNVADIAIVSGVGLIVLGLLQKNKSDKQAMALSADSRINNTATGGSKEEKNDAL